MKASDGIYQISFGRRLRTPPTPETPLKLGGPEIPRHYRVSWAQDHGLRAASGGPEGSGSPGPRAPGPGCPQRLPTGSRPWTRAQ